jgi:hypothetical protein
MPAVAALFMAQGAVAGFNPATLSPDLWLDPSDLTTLFQNSGGTGAVAADGDPVGYIGDKGASVSNCIQATAGARPLYKTSAGLRWLLFDGVSNYLRSVNNMLSFVTVSTCDILCAGKVTIVSAGTGGGALYNGDTFFMDITNGAISLPFSTDMVSVSVSGMAAFGYDTTFTYIADNYTSGAAFVAHMRHTGGILSLTINARTTVTVANANWGFGATQMNLGANYSNAHFTQLSMYGMFAKKTTLSAPDLASLKTWMGAKVGIVL